MWNAKSLDKGSNYDGKIYFWPKPLFHKRLIASLISIHTNPIKIEQMLNLSFTNSNISVSIINKILLFFRFCSPNSEVRIIQQYALCTNNYGILQLASIK